LSLTGKVWDKCTKEATVTTGGTKKQLNWTRERKHVDRMCEILRQTLMEY